MTEPRMYLSSLEVDDFRSYGPQFRLDVPARPSVLLLSGRNGLGKTSFFEAAEWCLTGSILRMELLTNGKIEAADLCRKGSTSNGFRVALQFTSGDDVVSFRREQIADETGRWLHATGSEVEQVARALSERDERWNVSPENFARCLHLTHFYPQTSALRLITQKPKERWAGISELAGVGLFELVRTQLTNTKRSLTALVQNAERRHDDARRRKEDWEDLIRHFNQATERLGSVGRGIPKAEIRSKLVAEAEKLSDALQVEPTGAGEYDLQELLGRLQSASRDWRERLDRRDSQLSRVKEIPARWSELSQRSETLASREEKLTREQTALAEHHGRQVQHLTSAREEADALAKNADELERRHVTAVRLSETVKEYAAAKERHRERVAEIERLNVRAELLGEQTRLSLGALTDRERLEQRAEEAARNRERIDEARAAVARLDAVARRLAAIELEQSRGQAEIDALVEASRAVQSEIDDALAQLAQAQSRLKQAQSSAEAFARAIATVASFLEETRTECPVCSTHFGIGELRERAAHAAEKASPDTAAIEAEVRSLEQRRSSLEARRAEIARQERRLKSERASSDEVVAGLIAERDALRANDLVSGESRQDQLTGILQKEQVAKDQQTAISAELATLGSIDELKEAVADAQEEASDVARDQRAADASKREAARYISEWDADLRALSGELRAQIEPSQLPMLVERLADDVSELRHQGSSKKGAATELSAQVRAMSEQLEELDAELAILRETAAELKLTVDGLSGRWREAELAGTPSEHAIDERAAGIAEERARCDDLDRVLDSAAESLRFWDEDQVVRDLEKRIRERAQERAPHDVMAEMTGEFEATEEELARAQRAREASDRLGDVLNKRTNKFNQEVISPLQAVLRSYLRALVHDERFHSVGMMSESAGRSARLRFELQMEDEPPGKGTDAEFILSEGQVAGLSLASLLAASTAYRWSRWRALLLDDPTQYNDLIHATALFEVLRNLVIAQGYQVVLSTHDPEQSAFFRRKLDASRIPWIECEYIGLGPQGVACQIERSRLLA